MSQWFEQTRCCTDIDSFYVVNLIPSKIFLRMYVVNFHNFINSLLSIDSVCSTKITHILHAFSLPVESVCGWGVGEGWLMV